MLRNRSRARTRSQPASPKLPRKLARLLPGTDADEGFIRGWLSRFHSDPAGLYTVLDARRAEGEIGGQYRRIIIEVAKFQPQRRGASAEWLVIRWCVDGVGVTFERCVSRAQAFARFAGDVTARDIVSSPEAIAGAASDVTAGRDFITEAA